MNKKQKLVLLLAVMVALLMGMLPPWEVRDSKPAGGFPIEYAPITSPPNRWRGIYMLKVDLSRFAVQSTTLLFVTTGLVLALGSAPARRREKAGRDCLPTASASPPD